METEKRCCHSLRSSKTEQCRPEHFGLFISATEKKKRVFLNTISFWIRLVVSDTDQLATDEDCRPTMIKASMMSYVTRFWKHSSSCESLARQCKENLPYDIFFFFFFLPLSAAVNVNM